jgi:enoyl-CoA hydratase/carnithine racemase
LIKAETRGRVARVAFDRPEKKNALTSGMYAQLTEALRAAERDRQVRVVLLQGSEECFTAGNDVSDFLKRQPGESSPVFGLFQVLPAFEKPVVAAVGIVPEFGSTLLLPRLSGYQRAAKLLLLGQPFTAQEAFEAGIVTQVVLKEKLFETAEAAAAMLAALPPESLKLTKRLMKQGGAKELEARIAEEGRMFVERLASPEAKEAMSAFLEKRKPDFSRF